MSWYQMCQMGLKNFAIPNLGFSCHDSWSYSGFSRERANAVEIDFGKIGHLRSLRRSLAVTCLWRSLAVTWAVTCGHLLSAVTAAVTCGHLALAVTWAVTCGHLGGHLRSLAPGGRFGDHLRSLRRAPVGKAQWLYIRVGVACGRKFGRSVARKIPDIFQAGAWKISDIFQAIVLTSWQRSLRAQWKHDAKAWSFYPTYLEL